MRARGSKWSAASGWVWTTSTSMRVEARGIRVIPAVGANVTAVAEYVIAADAKRLARRFLLHADVAAGAWPRQTLIGREAADKTIGLVGFGAIARAVVPRASALGMQRRRPTTLMWQATLPSGPCSTSSPSPSRRC